MTEKIIKEKSNIREQYINVSPLFVLTEKDKFNALVRGTIETPIGVLTTRPTKHYKKDDMLFRVWNNNPSLCLCIMLKCKKIDLCWDLSNGKCRVDKFMPFVYTSEKLNDIRREREFLERKDKVKKKIFPISEHERNMLIASLNKVGIREAQVNELLSKVTVADVLKFVDKI